MRRALLLSFLVATAGAQELSQIRFADVKAALHGGKAAVAPAVSAPAFKTNAEIIDSALSANRQIYFVMQRLDHSLPWPKSQVVWGEALRVQLECERAVAGVQDAYKRLETLREELADGADPMSVESGLRAALGGGDAAIDGAIPEGRDMADYFYYLAELRRTDPRAKDLVAHMGMVAAVSNLQRADVEMRKEAFALAAELAAKGGANIGSRDLALLDYPANLRKLQAGPWKEAGAELDAVARGIGPDNSAPAKAVQALRVFDAPPSR